MKLISWNVNGLRACLTHDFAASFAALDADVFSVQETKMQPGQADFAPEGYTEYTYSAEKKGYSGTACWCRQPPLAVTTGIGIEEHDHEGRVLTLDVPDCAATFRTTIQDMKTLMNQGVSTLVLTTEKGSTTLNLSLLCEGQTDTQRVVLRQLGDSAFLTVGLRCRRDLIVGR